jgi:hypothetical protein
MKGLLPDLFRGEKVRMRVSARQIALYLVRANYFPESCQASIVLFHGGTPHAQAYSRTFANLH